MEKFISFFIQRKITTLMFFLVVIILGLVSFTRLPTALMPGTDKKGLTISVRYPGQSPWRIERIISKPIEEAISGVGGIYSMTALSKEGEAKIYVTFEDDVDMKYKTLELREKIDPVRAYFPRDVDEPEIYGYSPDEKPIMIISMKSETVPIREQRELAEKRLKKIFQRVEGVSEINIGGGVRREIEVSVHDDRLITRGIGYDKISGRIQESNFSLPAGIIGEEEEYSILIDEKYKSIEDIKNTTLYSSKNGSVVLLKEMADIKDYAGKHEDISRIDGTPNVSLYIQKTGSAGVMDVAKALRSELKNIKLKDVELKITYDQSEYIKIAIDNLVTSCIFGILLASIILYLFFRSIRNSIPVLLAIPFSLITVFIYMYFNKMSINVISLSGLAIAAGMVVDNGIVVLENINTSVKDKSNTSPSELCSKGSFEMARAIFASTLTTVCIFIPIILFSGKTQSLYSDMAGAVIVALIASFFLAITMIPSLTSLLLEKKDVKIGSHLKERLQELILKLLCKLPAKKIQDRIKSLYGPLRERAKKLPSYEQIMEGAFNREKKIYIALTLLFIIALFLTTIMKKGYMDPLMRNEIYASVELPSGTNLNETSIIVSKIEKILKEHKSVSEVSSKVEKWHADLIIKIDKKSDKTAIIKTLKTTLQAEKSLNRDKAFVFFQEDRSSESSKELDIEITGPEIEKIRKIAKDLAARIGTLNGVDDVVLRFKEGRPEYDIEISSKKSALTGLSSGEIGDYVRNALFGPVSSKYLDMGEVDIRTRMKVDEKKAFDTIPSLRVVSADGKAIPLSEVAEFKETTGITTIWRKDKSRMESITVKLNDSDIETFAVKVEEEAMKLNLPTDYHIEFGESLKKMKESKKEMIIGVILAVLLVYMVIAGIFESLLLPLVVLISIPLAVIGVLLTLMIAGKTLNLPVYMGMIILVGIVVNNAIVLIDTIEKKKNIGTIDDTVIIEASKSRIRPILMTTLTTVFGLAPLLFGGEGSSMWQGFALTVIIGMLFSTVFVLVIIPLVYRSFAVKKNKNI